jgi:hypothetical protein
MADFKKRNVELPAGMGERDPKLSVWENVSNYFKSRKTVEPKQNVTSDPNALAEVSKSFKSVK